MVSNGRMHFAREHEMAVFQQVQDALFGKLVWASNGMSMRSKEREILSKFGVQPNPIWITNICNSFDLEKKMASIELYQLGVLLMHTLKILIKDIHLEIFAYSEG